MVLNLCMILKGLLILQIYNIFHSHSHGFLMFVLVFYPWHLMSSSKWLLSEDGLNFSKKRSLLEQPLEFAIKLAGIRVG